ncbi:Ala-tRNA(Pro) hydrolase [Endozoicomonas sp. OPT23]|uniref:alanyl-tRNA editing protein n=1 Tax=Endozoicomonas sp. OPT23 TaxID=2072845 RepID=UPI00129AA7D7|nr:alanyl-tRNA editing protein [Endozoicomonas sp. OPT23]MRI32863.1 Ala-tRNA(Pro) hydrolase [Endozoicomonas sp. OPT23]
MSSQPTPDQPAYIQDAYQRELSTRIILVNDKTVVLENTIFYPTGGGQPGDSGWLTSSNGEKYEIINTRRCRETNQIIHELAKEAPELKADDQVSLVIDWDRRYSHMRFHTCMHLLCSLIPAGVTGGALTDQKARLDFSLGEIPLPDEQGLTDQLNELIRKDMPVTVEVLDENILDEQPELVRTMSVQPPRGTGQLRMIRVQDTDFQPCGGTHVARTSEIGHVRISKVENKGKNNKRIQIVFE